MNKLKSIWTSITGSISSIIPLFFACCKSGACVGVCASPITSLFGISTASFMASPIFGAIVPLLIAISAVSFTISYYDLYVLPRYKNNCSTDCNCEDPAASQREKISKWIFWIGLFASIFFFAYFEINKYQAEKITKEKIALELKKAREKNIEGIVDSSEVEEPCCAGDSKCEK